MRLSPKQKRYWNEANCRWNVKYGATRSGKTYLDYFVIPRRLLAREGRPGLAVLLGNTRGTLERNVLAPMREIYGAQMVSPLRADGTATLFGQRVHCLGADNKRHVDRLRGASIKYCYGDEVVSWEREVFEMLKSRLDKEYSCFDGTCNPGGPGHWFKKFLDSGADVFSQQYGIDDNPFLPESVRAALKREYTGVFYQRYILGQWVAAEGAVYPMFERGRHVSANAPQTRFTWVGVDYGHTNPTAFVRLGLGEDGRVWALEEYYHASGETGARSPRQYAADLIRFARGSECVVIDPSAEGFILQLHEDSPALRLKKADNAVLEGVQLVSAALDAGKLMFHPRCERLIAEMEGYRWDERARERGEDKPRKEDDHAVDALRYGLMHYRRDVRRLCRQGT